MPPLSPLFRLSSRVPPTFASCRPTVYRAAPRFVARSNSKAAGLHSTPARRMASSTVTPVQEWLVIVPDFEGALEKRVAVRGDHLEGLNNDREGWWLFGGAMLKEPLQEGETPKMKGSAMLVAAKDREEILERLGRDAYTKAGVWDLDKIQIIPFKCALRKAM